MIPDLAWPIVLVRTADGRKELATVEQDSRAQIRQGLAMVAEVRRDDLEWDPELGITDPNGTTDRVETAALIELELRAIDTRAPNVQVEIVGPDGDRDLHLKVNV